MVLKAIIFDFDNTLADFRTAKNYAHKKLSEKLFREHSIYGPTSEELLSNVDRYYSVKGMSKKPQYFSRRLWAKELFRRAGIRSTQKMCSDFEMFYWRFVIERAKPLPYAITVLKRLRKNYKTAILSDSDGKKRLKTERIKVTGIYNFIDLFVTSDDTGQNKPSRKMYAQLLKKLGVKPGECVMVGDKPQVDLELAKRLGMTTVWMKYGGWSEDLKGKKFSYVDHAITDLRQLIEITKNKNDNDKK